MKVKISFEEQYYIVESDEIDGLKFGEILARDWPFYDELSQLIKHLQVKYGWLILAHTETEDFHYELKDNSDVLLVFHPNTPKALMAFRTKLYAMEDFIDD